MRTNKKDQMQSTQQSQEVLVSIQIKTMRQLMWLTLLPLCLLFVFVLSCLYVCASPTQNTPESSTQQGKLTGISISTFLDGLGQPIWQSTPSQPAQETSSILDFKSCNSASQPSTNLSRRHK